MARVKRAAAVAAQKKIRQVVNDFINDDIILKTGQKNSQPCDRRKKHKSSVIFDFDYSGTGTLQPWNPNKKSRVAHVVKKRSVPRGKRVRMRSNVDHQPIRGINSEYLPTRLSLDNVVENRYSSGSSVLSTISSSSTQTKRKTILLEFSTAEKIRIEQEQNRTRRSINSTGPMLLSRHTFYRMWIDQASPVSSPIRSTRLRFTPLAHLPTTPTPLVSNKHATDWISYMNRSIGWGMWLRVLVF